MMTAQHPLARLNSLLARTVAERDIDRLGELLRGEHLPALGGEQDPAELLLQSLEVPPYDPGRAKKLAMLVGEVLAGVYRGDEQALRSSRAEATPGRANTTLLNALILANALPAVPELFGALRRLEEQARTRGLDGLGLAPLLRRALIYQQVDDSLETYWLNAIAAVAGNDEPPSADEQTVLLDAWRGLLWIPPTDEGRRTGTVICFDRVQKGLLALSSAVSRHEAAKKLLERALRILSKSFPRSADF